VSALYFGGAHLVPCQEAKILLSPDNPQFYDFYELCVAAGAGDVEATLQAIDPSLYCPVGGVFADCGEDEMACHGELEYVGMGTGDISAEKWAQLCALSMLPVVTKIAGGHYVE
ncbi:MAG: hypothetical protein FJ098_06245, partial [Deltaproteobacteria bacterium]|nr:hypothetical protein [Deltaproteobacteria bacterium]